MPNRVFRHRPEDTGNLIPLLVVGGEESLVNGNLKRKLEGLGLHPSHHVTNMKVVESIPHDCQGVLIITDMCKHSLSNSAVELAKKKGLPFAAVQRKWSQAIEHIESAFANLITKPGDEPHKAPEIIPMPDPEKLQTWVVAYITQQVVEAKDPPSHDEIRGAAAAHFNIPQPERLGLTNMAIKQASVQAYRRITDTQHKVEDPMEHARNLPAADQVREAARMIILENPEVLLGARRTAVKQVRDLAGTPEVKKWAGKRIEKIWSEEAGRIQGSWFRLQGTTGDTEFRAEVDAMRNKWIYRMMSSQWAKDGVFPKVAKIMEDSKTIFGRSVHGSVVKAIRELILDGKPMPSETMPPVIPTQVGIKDVQQAVVETDSPEHPKVQEALDQYDHLGNHAHSVGEVLADFMQGYHTLGSALGVYHGWCRDNNVEPRIKSKDHFGNLVRDGRIKNGTKIPHPTKTNHRPVWGVQSADIIEWANEYHAKDTGTDVPEPQKSTSTENGSAGATPKVEPEARINFMELSNLSPDDMAFLIVEENAKSANRAFSAAFTDFREQMARATEQQMASLRSDLKAEIADENRATLEGLNDAFVTTFTGMATTIAKLSDLLETQSVHLFDLTAQIADLKDNIPTVPTIVTPEGVIRDPNIEYIVTRSAESTDSSPSIKSLAEAGLVVTVTAKEQTHEH